MKILYVNDKGNFQAAQFPSSWALLTSNQILLSQLKKTAWHPADNKHAFLWTDDYSNLVPLLKWK
jgi:hypothetical protein